MLTNKNIPPTVYKILKEMPYENMVKMYDTKCSGCPFSCIKLYNGKNSLKKFNTVEEAIYEFLNSVSSNLRIERTCNFNNEDISLREIVTNRCKFWDISEQEAPTDEDLFIIVEEIDGKQIEGAITHLRESFTNKIISQ